VIGCARGNPGTSTVSAPACGHNCGYNFPCWAAVVRLGTEIKPTRRHSQDGAGSFILDAALLRGLAFGGEPDLRSQSSVGALEPTRSEHGEDFTVAPDSTACARVATQ